MAPDPTDDGNQVHGEEEFLDSVNDSIERLSDEGGVAPEMMHRPPTHQIRMQKPKQQLS